MCHPPGLGCCQLSTESSCPAKAALSGWCPCRSPGSLNPALRWHHQRPTQANTGTEARHTASGKHRQHSHRLCQLARFIGIVHNLILEHGGVERQPQANRVRWSQLVSRYAKGFLVGVPGTIHGCGTLLAVRGHLRHVAIVVTFHFPIEDFPMGVVIGGDHLLTE